MGTLETKKLKGHDSFVQLDCGVLVSAFTTKERKNTTLKIVNCVFEHIT